MLALLLVVIFSMGVAVTQTDVQEVDLSEIQAVNTYDDIVNEIEVLDIDAPTENQYKVSGIVTNEEGVPLVGINVRLLDGSGSIEVQTIASGVYAFEGVPNGEYIIEIMYGAHASVFCYGTNEKIVVDDDVLCNLTVKVAKRAIVGTVRNSVGEKLNYVPYTIISADNPSNYYNGYTDYGVIEFFSFGDSTDIENGKYIISIADGKYFGKYYNGSTTELTISDNYVSFDTVLENVQKLNKYKIFGKLIDEVSDTPIVNADMKIYAGNELKGAIKTTANGKYEFNNLSGNILYTLVAFEDGIDNNYFYHEKRSNILITDSDKELNISTRKITPITITSQPLSLQKESNQSAIFDIRIENEGTPVSYRWQVDKGTGFKDIPNATAGSINGAQYYIRNVKPYMSGYKYRVIVSTKWGEIKSKAAVLRIVDNIYIKSIILNKKVADMGVSDTLKLKANYYPDDVTVKKVTWSTSDKDVVTISSTGVVKAKKIGTAIITARAGDGSNVTAKCVINVK